MAMRHHHSFQHSPHGKRSWGGKKPFEKRSAEFSSERRRDARNDEPPAARKEKKALVKGRTAKEDVLAVMKAYELPSKFPANVKTAAKKAAAKMQQPGERLDLRKKFIFTCDPVTAKDFDDALSLEIDRKGNRVLGVHIADVSHFVTPGSPLDNEAYKRSTSVYLQHRVVPMLPEELCNGVCSLVPNEDRLAFSAFLTFDKQGHMIARRFAKSIIRSKARFTYEQVMAVLSGGGNLDRKTACVVRDVGRLAQQLRANRFAEGALDLDVPETEILLDDEGEMTGLALRVNDESHQMVEECMVAANEAVAKELWTRGVRILARLHETPDPEKLDELRANLGALGVKCGDLSHGRNMSRFLASIKTHPLAGTLAVMVLRSMKRACYDARKIGHFGLAKAYYAHFTSPIRRYPDLTLHRQLAAFVSGGNPKMPQAWLDKTAEHCSTREEAADDAERMLDEVKKYRFLEEHGGEFDATVGKVMPFGVFVDVPALAVSGMVHVSHLSRRYVNFNEATGVLGDGRRSWRVGDKIRVRVIKVDWGNRWIDFEGVDAR